MEGDYEFYSVGDNYGDNKKMMKDIQTKLHANGKKIK